MWSKGRDGSKASARGDAATACRPNNCRQMAESSAAGNTPPSIPPESCVFPPVSDPRLVVKELLRPLDADTEAEARRDASVACALAPAVDHSNMPAPPPATNKPAGSRENVSAVTFRRPNVDGIALPRRQKATHERAPLSVASS